eukprot:1159654-Pelagomonas_calceolata.AAC.1
MSLDPCVMHFTPTGSRENSTASWLFAFLFLLQRQKATRRIRHFVTAKHTWQSRLAASKRGWKECVPSKFSTGPEHPLRKGIYSQTGKALVLPFLRTLLNVLRKPPMPKKTFLLSISSLLKLLPSLWGRLGGDLGGDWLSCLGLHCRALQSRKTMEW